MTRGAGDAVDLKEIDELPTVKLVAARISKMRCGVLPPLMASVALAVTRNVVADVTHEELGRVLGNRGRARPNLDLGSRDVQHSSPVCGVRHAPTSASASGGPSCPRRSDTRDAAS